MSSDFIPLTDLGSAQYLGFAGGLYIDGKNEAPSVYVENGVALGAVVQPLDRKGKPSRSGKIAMISIGMSNTSDEFLQFIQLADAHKNSSLEIIDAALEGAAATRIAIPYDDYWIHVNRRLQCSEVSAPQVQVVWLKTALARDRRSFPENARLFQRTLYSIAEILGAKFPQLKLVYISSRTYGGYSGSDLSPEPAAYESGFGVKWFIEECINKSRIDRSTPWVSWGPYLWADGMTPRSDGLIWRRSDFGRDGVHMSEQGALKVATMLLEFFQNDITSKSWFLPLMT